MNYINFFSNLGQLFQLLEIIQRVYLYNKAFFFLSWLRFKKKKKSPFLIIRLSLNIKHSSIIITVSL
jgi:hypothetical protein